ncbi:transglutaminase domain-containing protein [Pseudonocardiaceae bacterium YIM PH 21723]|nr:transglutaminase domain-containing protein [Pseudonocardiaceae bacterium YIM PH 21723]
MTVIAVVRGLPLFAHVALCALAAAAGALVYTGFFVGSGFLTALVTAAVAAAILAAVAVHLRGTAPLIGSAGFVLFASFVLVPETLASGLPTGRTLQLIGTGFTGGWSRLLTVGLPALSSADLLIIPAAIIWTGAFLATSLALHGCSAVVSAVPTVVALGLALLIAGEHTGQGTAAAFVLLAAHGVQLLLDGGSVRLAAVLMLVAGLVAGLIPFVSGVRRFDPRALYRPPVQVADVLNPLAAISGQVKTSPPQPLFTVRMTAEAANGIERIRIVALDHFDGRLWTEQNEFRAVSVDLRESSRLARAKPVAADIEITGLVGPYLPVLGTVTALSRPDSPGTTGLNADRDVLATTQGLLRGLRYRLDAAAALPGLQLNDVPVGRIPADSSPAAPQPISDLARRYRGRDYIALSSLQSAFPCSVDSHQPAGQSYADLAEVVSGQRASGSAEQCVAAFTVLARAAGFPARTAVGYRLRTYADGGFRVTTADAKAWTEVLFDGVGWVPFDPAPSDSPRPREESPTAAQSEAVSPTGRQDSRDAGAESRSSSPPAVTAGNPLLMVGVLAALAVLCLPAVPLVKALRRSRRRHRGDLRAQVCGAWCEQRDRLVERGFAISASYTAGEVATLADQPAVTAMVPLVDAAIYAAELPADSAQQAWRLVRRLRADLYPGRVSLPRLLAALDPRPLRGLLNRGRE